MTKIYSEQHSLYVSNLGKPNPLPAFRGLYSSFSDAPSSLNLSLDERENDFNWGSHSILPYQLLDDYDRSQEDGSLSAIFIENDHLKLTVYPQYGGRLASIYYKTEDRELLFHNPVFQPANLAILNAWFSGGIEWNGLMPGHTLVTCSPVFAAKVETDSGPILRLYEFDRVREAIWQVDLYLPPDEAKVWVHGKIINPNPHPIKCYWWTNMTTTLEEKTRVFSPADYCIEHVLPSNHLDHFSFPHAHDYDGSYPANYDFAASVFFRKPSQNRPWIVAVHGNGRGLLQTSTLELQARKMFVFGNQTGGKRWMDFLSLPSQGDYVELQSGLMPTQNQEIDLEANGVIEWTECITPFALEDAIAHEPDYHKACVDVEAVAFEHVPDSELYEKDIWLREQANTVPSEVLHVGSAWGMLHEKMISEQISTGLIFDTTPTTEVFWAELLESGQISESRLSNPPESWAVSERWQTVLEKMVTSQDSIWLHELLLGVIDLNNKLAESARQRFEQSLKQKDNYLAYRNLALIAKQNGNIDEAKSLYIKAWELSDSLTALAVEFCNFLQEENDLESLEDFLGMLPRSVSEHERIRLAQGQLCLNAEDFDGLREILDGDFCTVREGETLLTDLWFALQLRETEINKGHSLTDKEKQTVKDNFPPPYKIDFRMI